MYLTQHSHHWADYRVHKTQRYTPVKCQALIFSLISGTWSTSFIDSPKMPFVRKSRFFNFFFFLGEGDGITLIHNIYKDETCTSQKPTHGQITCWRGIAAIQSTLIFGKVSDILSCSIWSQWVQRSVQFPKRNLYMYGRRTSYDW